jgi:hypothetical protein
MRLTREETQREGKGYASRTNQDRRVTYSLGADTAGQSTTPRAATSAHVSQCQGVATADELPASKSRQWVRHFPTESQSTLLPHVS